MGKVWREVQTLLDDPTKHIDTLAFTTVEVVNKSVCLSAPFRVLLSPGGQKWVVIE